MFYILMSILLNNFNELGFDFIINVYDVIFFSMYYIIQ